MEPYSLRDLVDLALCTPEVGAVNFNILRTLLLNMLDYTGIGDAIVQNSRDLLFDSPSQPKLLPRSELVGKVERIEAFLENAFKPKEGAQDGEKGQEAGVQTDQPVFVRAPITPRPILKPSVTTHHQGAQGGFQSRSTSPFRAPMTSPRPSPPPRVDTRQTQSQGSFYAPSPYTSNQSLQGLFPDTQNVPNRHEPSPRSTQSYGTAPDASRSTSGSSPYHQESRSRGGEVSRPLSRHQGRPPIQDHPVSSSDSVQEVQVSSRDRFYEDSSTPKSSSLQSSYGTRSHPPTTAEILQFHPNGEACPCFPGPCTCDLPQDLVFYHPNGEICPCSPEKCTCELPESVPGGVIYHSDGKICPCSPEKCTCELPEYGSTSVSRSTTGGARSKSSYDSSTHSGGPFSTSSRSGGSRAAPGDSHQAPPQSPQQFQLHPESPHHPQIPQSYQDHSGHHGQPPQGQFQHPQVHQQQHEHPPQHQMPSQPQNYYQDPSQSVSLPFSPEDFQPIQYEHHQSQVSHQFNPRSGREFEIREAEDVRVRQVVTFDGQTQVEYLPSTAQSEEQSTGPNSARSSRPGSHRHHATQITETKSVTRLTRRVESIASIQTQTDEQLRLNVKEAESKDVLDDRVKRLESVKNLSDRSRSSDECVMRLNEMTDKLYSLENAIKALADFNADAARDMHQMRMELISQERKTEKYATIVTEVLEVMEDKKESGTGPSEGQESPRNQSAPFHPGPGSDEGQSPFFQSGPQSEDQRHPGSSILEGWDLPNPIRDALEHVYKNIQHQIAQLNPNPSGLAPDQIPFRGFRSDSQTPKPKTPNVQDASVQPSKSRQINALPNLNDLRDEIKTAKGIPRVFDEKDVLERLETLWEAVQGLRNNEENLAVQLIGMDAKTNKMHRDLMEAVEESNKNLGRSINELSTKPSTVDGIRRSENTRSDPKLTDDLYSTLNNLVNDDAETRAQVVVLTDRLADLGDQLVTRDMLVDATQGKVDRSELQGKVSYDEFGKTVHDLTGRLQDLVREIFAKNKGINEGIACLAEELESKLDKGELTPLRKFMKCNFKELEGKVNKILEIMEDPDPAGTRKKLLKDYNCISCDRQCNISGLTNAPTLPHFPPIPPCTSNAPNIAFDLHRIRGNGCGDRPQSMDFNLMEKQARANKAVFGCEQGNPMYSPDISCLVNRYTGGSHTSVTPTSRIRALRKNSECFPSPQEPIGGRRKVHQKTQSYSCLETATEEMRIPRDYYC